MELLRRYKPLFDENFKLVHDINTNQVNLIYDPTEKEVTIDTSFISATGKKLPFGRSSRTIAGYHVPIIELFGFNSNLESDTIANIRNLIKGKNVEDYSLDKESYKIFIGQLIYSLGNFFKWFPYNIDMVTNVESSASLSTDFFNHIKAALYLKEQIKFIQNGILKNYRNATIDLDIFDKIPSMTSSRYETMLGTLQDKGLHKSIRPTERKFVRNHVKISDQLFDYVYSLIYEENRKEIGIVFVDDFKTDGTTLRESVVDFIETFRENIVDNNIKLNLFGLYMFSNSIQNTNVSNKVSIGKVATSPWHSKEVLDFSTYL